VCCNLSGKTDNSLRKRWKTLLSFSEKKKKKKHAQALYFPLIGVVLLFHHKHK